MNKCICFFVLFSLFSCDRAVKQENTDVNFIERYLVSNIAPNYRPQDFDGDPEPKIFPNLTKNKETLLGIDEDNDGVRDDLEIYINRRLKYDYERWIAKKQVRASREFFLKADKVSTKEARELERLVIEQACDEYIFGKLKKNSSYNDDRSIEYYFSGYMVFDTELRNSFKLKHLKLNGEDTSPLLNLTVEESCPKEVYEKYIKKSESK